MMTDAAGLLEQLCGALDRLLLPLLLLARGQRRLRLSERPEQHVRNERFMARHMMIERINPLEPSSAPAVTSSLLFKNEAHRDRGETVVEPSLRFEPERFPSAIRCKK